MIFFYNHCFSLSSIYLILVLRPCVCVMCAYIDFFRIEDHAETKPMKSIVADICDTEAIEDVFDNVDVVFHCAALINFQFPPNMDALERVNVDGKSAVWHLSLFLLFSTLITWTFIITFWNVQTYFTKRANQLLLEQNKKFSFLALSLRQ